MSLARNQKVASFIVGVTVAGAAYISTQRIVWKCTADLADHSRGAPFPSSKSGSQALRDEHLREQGVRRWNQAVDSTFRPVIAALSKRNL